MDVSQFKELIIIPALKATDTYSESAVNLLLGTAIIESRLKYLQQTNGPALGVYQIEPSTYNFLLGYISRKHFLLEKIKNHCCYNILPLNYNHLIYNLAYATIIARCRYLVVAEKLPDKDDIKALAMYWKQYYNTRFGKGNPLDFIRLYKEHVHA